MTKPDLPALSLLASALQLDMQLLQTALADAESGAYKRWQVPKGYGKTRQLASPTKPLREVQRAILERLLYRIPISPFAHGFTPGRSIVSNAKVHAGTAQALVSLDLQDAFPSVTKQRIHTILQWHLGPLFKYDLAHGATKQTLTDIYALLATLCTDQNQLPQGAPTSGMLLNLACTRLDRLIYRCVCQSGRSDMHYSRYADDLCISDSQSIDDAFIERLLQAVVASGFTPNRTKLARINAKQRDLVICGIRLHQGQLTLPRKTLRRYRALFHQVAYTDNVSIELRQQFYGVLGLLRMIYPCCPALLESPLQALIAKRPQWLHDTNQPVADVVSSYWLIDIKNQSSL